MSYHEKNIGAPVKALIAAGHHLRKKDGADPFELLTKKFGDLTDETLKRIGNADQGIAEVKERLISMDQKLARASEFGSGSAAPAPSWGREMVETMGAEIKALSETNQGRVGLNVKATLTTGISSGGAIDIPTRDATVGMPQQRLTVRNLLNVISISTGSVEYASQTTRPTAAAMVAEGALKPESAIDWELKTTSAKVIAHWIKASRQVLEDAPQLRDLIDSELRYGLALKEEQQLLNGDGTGANLLGMIPSATTFVDPIGPTAMETMIDVIGKAILQSAMADFPATGIVIHPADWWRMRLLKDAEGRYLLGDPQAVIQPSLFGLPVVATKAMIIDKFLVGDFPSAGTLYDRWAPRVEVGYVNDDFVRNLTTILAEERIAYATKQGKALTYGDFGFGV
jgi:HK97 family phage major capsid protein